MKSNSKWIMDANFTLSCWEDNWLKVPLIDILNFTREITILKAQIKDLLGSNGSYNLPEVFKEKFLFVHFVIEAPKISSSFFNTLVYM